MRVKRPVGWRRQQELRRTFSNGFRWYRDGGQGGIEVFRDFEVVEANDG